MHVGEFTLEKYGVFHLDDHLIGDDEWQQSNSKKAFTLRLFENLSHAKNGYRPIIRGRNCGDETLDRPA